MIQFTEIRRAVLARVDNLADDLNCHIVLMIIFSYILVIEKIIYLTNKWNFIF